MKITFLGAAKTVTGSNYLCEGGGKRFLVDCGMYQGGRAERDLNAEPFAFDVHAIDFVILTHAHIDHSGRIPKLFKEGFRGDVHATKATAELAAIMLPDSGHIQEAETEWENRKRMRAGVKAGEPLYTAQQATECLRFFRKHAYDEWIEASPTLRYRFRDAGHILGSSIMEIVETVGGKPQKFVFSGDLGNHNSPILRDPTAVGDADCLVCESTYGDRNHQRKGDLFDYFVDVIDKTIRRGGNVIIPSFAVGRTQEVIYQINKDKDNIDGRRSKLANVPVFVDSPLATLATDVFRNNLDCFAKEARKYIENGDNPLDFPRLYFTETAEDSKELNADPVPKVIISASGMCEAGRVKHHLKHNLWRPECTILFVGYQAEGTLGRSIVEGAHKVKIFGEEVMVKAEIVMIEGFSGHADRDGLLDWMGTFAKWPANVFLTHGEETVMETFADTIKARFGACPLIPGRGQSFEILPAAAAQAVAPALPRMAPASAALRERMESMRDRIAEILDARALSDEDAAALRRITDEFEAIAEKARAATAGKT